MKNKENQSFQELYRHFIILNKSKVTTIVGLWYSIDVYVHNGSCTLNLISYKE